MKPKQARYRFPAARCANLGGNRPVLLLNQQAADLLRQDGATEMAIIRDPATGAISIQPLEIANVIAVVKLSGPEQLKFRGQTRITFTNQGAMIEGKYYRCQWNDVDGRLEITAELAEEAKGKSAKEKSQHA